MPSNAKNLISGRRIARNTIWNLAGHGVPLLVAVFTIPLLIRGLGTSRFGVLTLAWAIVGYFSLFDLGMGRAVIKLVAERLGTVREEDIPNLIWTSQAIMGMFSIVGALAAAGLMPWLVKDVLKIPLALQSESLRAFLILAFSIPFVISSSGLRGILEAYQRFDLANIVNISLGMVTFLGPLIALQFSKNLLPVMAVLVIGRFLAWGLQLKFCLNLVPALRRTIKPQRHMARSLVSLGSWMTVSNIVGPLMLYLDRFLIGALISVAAVAFYTTPYEVVTKLGLISGALVGVLFPAFASTFVQDKDRAARLFGRGINVVFILLFPLVLIIVTMAHEGMALWLGAEFAEKSTYVLQWLCVGVFMNSIAQVPFALIQSAGHPDYTAKLHIIELPFYLMLLWWLLGTYGIRGAAVAWVARIGVDTLILFVLVQRLLPNTKALIWKSLFRIIFALMAFIVAGYAVGVFLKLIFIIGVLIGFILVTWYRILAPEEKEVIRASFRHCLKRTRLIEIIRKGI